MVKLWPLYHRGIGMGVFRQEEVEFLKRHGFSEDDVLDARHENSDLAKLKAKSLGKSFYLGTPCRNVGHRIRTRGGHCAMCDPSKIAHARRHSAKGTLYLAVSSSGKVFKIGSSDDHADRERQLRAKGYGGYRDWEIICSATVQRKGEAEILAARALEGLHAPGVYRNGEFDQSAKEMYQTSLRNVLKAFAAAVNATGGSDLWKHPQLAKFDKL